MHALTPSELRVAQLATQPLSNRDIAQALFITTKTVSDHLSSAYRKLSDDILSWCQIASSGDCLDTVTSTNSASLDDLADDSQTPHGDQRARQLTEWIKSHYHS